MEAAITLLALVTSIGAVFIVAGLVSDYIIQPLLDARRHEEDR